MMEFRDLLSVLLPKASKWDLIGIQLGLSPDELDIIRANNSGDVEACLRKVLQKWYERRLNPRWEEIVAALKSPALGEIRLAKDLEQTKSILPKPMSDDLSTGIVKENRAKIKGSFATLVTRVTDQLKKKETDMSSFRIYVINLFPPGDIISETFSMAEIFEAISRHQLWDYSNYVPIEGIITEFGGDNPELSRWMNDYKSELAGFKATTKIIDYIRVCDEDDEIADSEVSLRQNMARYDKRYCRKLTIKLKSRITEKCLDYIDQFWRSIADHFFLPSLTVLLDSIHQGCIEVTWLIPALFALQVQANVGDSTEFFQQQEVMQVILDGDILYDDVGMEKRLLLACERKQVDEVTALLTYGVDADAADPETGRTALMKASRAGDLEVIDILLQHQATIDKQDKDGYTALMNAVCNGKLNVIQFLIVHNADINNIAKDGWSSLKIACKYNYPEVVKLLIKHGANIQCEGELSPLMVASNPVIFKILLEYGADVDEISRSGWTALTLACSNGDLQTAKLLLEQNASPNIHEKGWWSALMYVIDLPLDEKTSMADVLSMIQSLLDAGASINYETEDHWSPLKLACHAGLIDIVKLLIERGVDVNSLSEGERWTPLVHAATKGHLEICQILLEHGSAVDPEEAIGITPLVAACLEGHFEIFMLMLEHGANIQARHKDVTAIHLACQEGHLDIVKELHKHGAIIDDLSADGATPLMLACLLGHLDVVQYLLEQKASVNSTTKGGWSSLTIACGEGRAEIVAELLKHGADTELCIHGAGLSPLILATKKGDLNTVKQLLMAKAQVDYSEETGWSPLTVACDGGHAAIVAELLKHGASTEQYIHKPRLSPLIIATKRGNLDIVEQLLLAKAQVDLTTESSGWSALFYAAKRGHLGIVKLLIEYGADISLTAKKNGESAYDVASIYGQTEICEEFGNHGYKPQTPPTENIKKEVELYDQVLTPRFLDVENIRTFREVLSHPRNNSDIPKFGSNLPPQAPWES